MKYKGWPYEYEPNAIAVDVGTGQIVRLFCYNSVRTLKEAEDIIKVWAEDFKLLSSYIRHCTSWDGKIVCAKFYEDNIQHFEYGGYRVKRG